MIKTYKKRPVEIQAVQWTGENAEEIEEFVGDHCGAVRYIYDKNVYKSSQQDRTELIIHTLEGDHHASIGDYIIRGVKGEFYPCKPDIFEETYIEKVEHTESNFQGQVSLFDYDGIYPGLITED